MPSSYCASRFHTVRRRTHEVRVGAVGVGGAHPLRIQSMTTSDTQDVAATVRQSIALAEVGCEIIRITAPNVQAAKCLKDIRAQFSAAGFAHIPLVADIHFLPAAALEAVEHVEKVRVNPGNYADKKKFAVRDYTDADYEAELQRIHDSFTPLVLRAKALGRSLRIGTNHGSLSDRIMNRYGDTPLGMVESALEFLRIGQAHGFDQMILSMKSSNPKVMIQAYRLLVARMNDEGMTYPLHLGVTEAGDGEDGRIKSAIGIGSLLTDGLGDTLRVSLTEDSVYEIPVARALAARGRSAPAGMTNDQCPMTKGQTPASPPLTSDLSPSPSTPDHSSFVIRHQSFTPGHSSLVTGHCASAGGTPADAVDPFHFTRRDTAPLALAPGITTGPEQPPRVIVRVPSLAALPAILDQLAVPRLADTPAEGLLVPVATPEDLTTLGHTLADAPHRPPFLVLELPSTLAPADLSHWSLVTGHWSFRPASGGTVVFLRAFTADDADALTAFVAFVRAHGHVLALATTDDDLALLGPTLRRLGDDRLLVTLNDTARSPLHSADHPVGRYRALADALHTHGSHAPLWIRNTPSLHTPATGHSSLVTGHSAAPAGGGGDFLSRLLDASILTGSLLCDGLGDLVSIETESDAPRATTLAYNILQGAGARISKTEFVACPSCGRTLFDLQTTTQRIRAQTGHLKGVKLAIMGCIVNGPGEMADADFGYVGGAPGKINLYVGKTCVQYNIPQAEADQRLIALIKEHGKWTAPPAL